MRASSPEAIRKHVRHNQGRGSLIASPRRSAWAKASATVSLATSRSPVKATIALHSLSPWSRYSVSSRSSPLTRVSAWCTTPTGRETERNVNGRCYTPWPRRRSSRCQHGECQCRRPSTSPWLTTTRCGTPGWINWWHPGHRYAFTRSPDTARTVKSSVEAHSGATFVGRSGGPVGRSRSRAERCLRGISPPPRG
jgi:hypothetical protein